jgi:hypothetical protein
LNEFVFVSNFLGQSTVNGTRASFKRPVVRSFQRETVSTIEMAKSTKQQVIESISNLIGVDAPEMSTGSTEPKKIFELINAQLGLGIEPDRAKPEFAREIVERAGLVWSPDCESRGSTVTLEGLILVLDAVRFFVQDD